MVELKEVLGFISQADEDTLKVLKKACSDALKSFDEAKPTIYDNLRKLSNKYEGVRFVYLGRTTCGAYECQGELGIDDFTEYDWIEFGNIFKWWKEYKPITKDYKTAEEFENAFLHVHASEEEIKEAMKGRKKFTLTLENASILRPGEECVYIYDIQNDNIFAEAVQTSY